MKTANQRRTRRQFLAARKGHSMPKYERKRTVRRREARAARRLAEENRRILSP